MAESERIRFGFRFDIDKNEFGFGIELKKLDLEKIPKLLKFFELTFGICMGIIS